MAKVPQITHPAFHGVAQVAVGGQLASCLPISANVTTAHQRSRDGTVATMISRLQRIPIDGTALEILQRHTGTDESSLRGRFLPTPICSTPHVAAPKPQRSQDGMENARQGTGLRSILTRHTRHATVRHALKKQSVSNPVLQCVVLAAPLCHRRAPSVL